MTRLISALLRLAFLQRQSLDKNALQSVLAELEASNDTLLAPKALLKLLKTKLRWTQLQELSEKTLDPSQLPCLIVRDHGDWRILKSFNSQSQWVLETDNTETVHTHLSAYRVFRINFQTPFEPSDSPVWKLIKSEIRQHQSQLIDAGISGVMLNVVALAISFYSMQIYDRVIPTNASATLWVLSLGVLAAIVFEWLSRSIRSNLNDVIVTHVDQRLGREVFLRFLNVRLDKLPQSVGSLTGQLKAYESVRSFLTNSAAQMLIDAPFAILFLITIGVISGWLTLIPLAFLLISIWIGLRGLREIESRSHAVSMAHMLSLIHI
jgi:ATP-binding cassette subfamily C protein LapB